MSRPAVQQSAIPAPLRGPLEPAPLTVADLRAMRLTRAELDARDDRIYARDLIRERQHRHGG